MMITCVEGLPRSGKSTMIAQRCYKLKRKGYPVFTDGISVKGIPRVDLDDLAAHGVWLPMHSQIFIDESGVSYDNKHDLPAYLREYFKYHGHAKHNIEYYSQSSEDTNIVLRRMTEKVYDLSKFGLFSFASARYMRKVVKPFNPQADFFDPSKGYGEVLVGFKPSMLRDFRFCFRPFHYSKFDSYCLPDGVTLLEKDSFAD